MTSEVIPDTDKQLSFHVTLKSKLMYNVKSSEYMAYCYSIEIVIVKLNLKFTEVYLKCVSYEPH